MIGDKDFDHLAKQLGYDSMKAVREERLAEAWRKAEEEQEAQQKAVKEEQERIRLAEDQEINEALQSGRMVPQIDNEVYRLAKTFNDIVCTGCGKLPNFMRETLLMCVRRATFRGELRMPVWWRSASNTPYDTVPTGARGDGLKVLAPSHLFQGKAPCTECGRELDICVEVACEHDGERVKSIRGQ